MELKGSKSERNLLMAFAGESQARNRYTYSRSQARSDGFIQIATIFEETANQEKEHAKRFFKFLQGGEVKIECAFPAGILGTTAENLLAAAKGEHEEWSVLYPGFETVARGGGFSGHRHRFREDFRCRKTARAALPVPSGEHPERPGVQARPECEVAVPELRLRPRRPRCPGRLPCLCSSSGIL